MGPTHRLLGACTGLAWATGQGLGPGQTTVSIAVAVLTSAGFFSPDVDQSTLWRTGDHLAPDELLGRGGPLQHRGITHWWGLPVAAAYATAVLVPAGLTWLAGAAIAGWSSHLFGDLIFGKADVRSARGPGVPLMPWWGHLGLGLDTDGVLERLVVQRLLLPGLLLWQAAVALGWARWPLNGA